MKNNNLIEIKINKELISFQEKENIESLEKELFKLYSKIIEIAHEKNIWSEKIERLIITNDFKNHITEYAKKWSIDFKITHEKEYAAISKILFNRKFDDPKYILFLIFIFTKMYKYY